jgi:hypothetical protein
MPSPEEILKTLTLISNKYMLIAEIWHVLFLALIVLLLIKWRPSNRLMSVMLSLPAVSVGVVNFMAGNPFNGIVFALLCVLFLIFGLRAGKDWVMTASVFPIIVGALMIIYGFFYPHFLNSDSWTSYLYAAPTGLIPCPTLALLIGFAMVFEGFRSKGWSLTLIVAGLFYGIFGIFRLKVYLDIVLLAGTLIFLVQILFAIDFKKGK